MGKGLPIAKVSYDVVGHGKECGSEMRGLQQMGQQQTCISEIVHGFTEASNHSEPTGKNLRNFAVKSLGHQRHRTSYSLEETQRTTLLKERRKGAYTRTEIPPEDLRPNSHFDATLE